MKIEPRSAMNQNRIDRVPQTLNGQSKCIHREYVVGFFVDVVDGNVKKTTTDK